MDQYTAFYEEHKDKLFSYLMRMTRDYQLSTDIMQESFTRFLEHYEEKGQSVPLLYTIARNLVFDYSRKREGTVQLETDPYDCSQDDAIDHERVFMVRQEYRRVLSAMHQLEKDERDILALVVTSELSYREIASLVCMSEANVKVKVHRARLKLRKILLEGKV